MWLKFVNQGGFPNIVSTALNTADGVTTISFNDHPYRQTNRFFGGFFVKIAQTTPEAALTNPVKFDTQGVSGSAVDVYLPNGTPAKVENLTSAGQSVYLCYYDRDSNRVQIIG